MHYSRFITWIGLLAGLGLGQGGLFAQFNWRFVHPSPSEETIHAIAVTADEFVVSGSNGLIMTSVDGVDWTRQVAGTRERFEHVESFNGRSFAMGNGGTIFVSEDARKWHQRTDGGGGGSMAYGNGIYVAASEQGSNVIRFSADGDEWTEVAVTQPRRWPGLTKLVFQGGRFWLFLEMSGLWSSVDGVTWTEVTTQANDLSQWATTDDLVAGRDRLIVLRRDGVSLFAYTLDAGEVWTRLPGLEAINEFADVNGRYLLRAGLEVRVSTDAVTWETLPDFPSELRLSTIRQRAGVWLGLDGKGRLRRSIDGENWTEVGVNRTLPRSGLVFVSGHFVMGDGLRSADGEIWSEDGFDPAKAASDGTADWLYLNGVNEQMIATLVRKIEGIDYTEFWLSTDSETGRRVWQGQGRFRASSIYFSSDRYLVMLSGNSGRKFLTSSDGVVWSKLTLRETPEPIVQLLGADGEAFYGQAESGSLYRSVDGESWVLDWEQGGSPRPTRIAAESPGRLLAQADRGHYRRSPGDGWTYYPAVTIAAPHYSGSHWCAVTNLVDQSYLNYQVLVTDSNDGTWGALPYTLPISNWRDHAIFASGNGLTVFVGGDLIAVADNVGDLVLRRGLPLRVDGIVGTPISLSVEAESRSGASLSYQWTAGGVDIAEANAATLVVNFDDDSLVPPRYGVRVTDGKNVINCETLYSLFEQPVPEFVYEAPREHGIAVYYRKIATDRYQVTLWAPTRGPGQTTYVWRREGKVIEGATTDRFKYEVNALDAALTITLTASNDWGYSSRIAHREAGPQPTADLGGVAIYDLPMEDRLYMSMRVVGRYFEKVQWRRNGSPILGATQPSYSDNSIDATESGFYDAVVSSPFGSITTSSIFVPASGGYLSNLSVRAWTGQGEKAVVPGVVLARPISMIPLLVRAVGPGLIKFGVSGVVQDPGIVIKDSTGALLFSNDQWWDTEEAGNERKYEMGAFPLDEGSMDAAIWVEQLPVQNHTSLFTAPVSGEINDAGQILVEVYRAFSSWRFDVRLINLSCRAVVAEDKPLVAGFVVDGTGPVKLLVRAVGPTLQEFGVEGVLPNPRLVLRNSDGEEVGNNDSWWQAANVDDIESSRALVGAFELVRQGNDAALFVTLEPGVYTAEVETVDGGAGVGLVEIYEVP